MRYRTVIAVALLLAGASSAGAAQLMRVVYGSTLAAEILPCG